MVSKFRNSGQTCVCANRFLVQDAVHDRFVDKLALAARSLRVGPGLEAGVEQGPLISPSALAKVESLVADALAKGARLVTGGRRHALGGAFYEPTVLADVRPGMRVLHDEIFGPVAPVLRFRDESEAIDLANDTRHGLAAYFYARDLGRVWRVAEALEYGMVAVNEGILSTEVAPFGGVKESGLGREGSRYGLDEYLEIKYLLLGGLGA
jgi:succinate-semialdehyde dehydrogenase/glutarate-semialdehyde dehydrogenase